MKEQATSIITEILTTHLVPFQEYIFGFADLRGLLIKKFEGYQYGLSIGKRLNDKIINNLDNGPTIEYYNHYNQLNKELAEVSEKIESDFNSKGIVSLAIIPTILTGTQGYEEYMETLSFDISHKMVATRAGMGWIGKTDLFISEQFGPRIRLVTILLKEDPGRLTDPVIKSKCGKCNICVIRCPAKAANGKLWDINTCREEFFDASRCREKCAELARQKLKVSERICGLCISVCPYGQKKKQN